MSTEAIRIPSKLPDVGTTIFTVTSKLANEHNAINLSQGFPDFDCDPDLIETVSRHLRTGNNQYAPMQGVMALREALSRQIKKSYGATYDPDTEITVTSGATEALFCTIAACVSTGDEVIILEPCYDSYVPIVRLCGGVPVFVTLRFPDYKVNWEEIKHAITEKTRLLILNSPHNPTGMVFSKDDLNQLKELLRQTNIVVLSDEVYEHVIFDGLQHESLARSQELAARSCIVSSLGKTYHATGWRIGHVVAPEPLTHEIRKIHQFVTFASNTPIQHAYAEFLGRRTDENNLAKFFQDKRDYFLSLIKESRFKPIISHGTYFQLLDYSFITDEPDKDFSLKLLKTHGVAAIPTSAFLFQSEAPPVLRFCFAKKTKTLQAAARCLCEI